MRSFGMKPVRRSYVRAMHSRIVTCNNLSMREHLSTLRTYEAFYTEERIAQNPARLRAMNVFYQRIAFSKKFIPS